MTTDDDLVKSAPERAHSIIEDYLQNLLDASTDRERLQISRTTIKDLAAVISDLDD